MWAITELSYIFYFYKSLFRKFLLEAQTANRKSHWYKTTSSYEGGVWAFIGCVWAAVIYYTSAGSARAVTHSSTAALAYCQGVTSEGHPFHQLFYLHPKLYVHEKCASVFAKAHRGRWNFCSLMHANLCRWHRYCWKMDCLIKHIIRHICCLADQIEVVFCTNFFVKFVNVHVIFVLGHGKRRKFQACHAGPICSRFWGWTDFFFPQGLFHNMRETDSGCAVFFFMYIWLLPGQWWAERYVIKPTQAD